MTCSLYLRPNVASEPLFNQWYAWWYLLSPLTAPLFVKNLHVKLMTSFVAAPQLHAAALADPALAGGPYLNHPPERVDEVRALLTRTIRDQAESIAFADAIAELDVLLAAAPRGFSLEALYPRVPDLLRGFVELVYDLNNCPSPRFIEPLLYASRHFRPSCQSVALRRIDSDARPYVFSTPRLPDSKTVHVQVPFAHPLLDALFRMHDEPGDPRALYRELGIDGDERVFDSLFTEAPPRPRPPRHAGPGLRIRYFGHACVLLETAHTSILTDPVISYEYDAATPRFSNRDLPAHIDYVLITHGHADHLMLESLLQLRGRIGTIVVPRSGGAGPADPSLELMLRACGFDNVRGLGELERIEVEGGSITGLPFLGEHCDLDIRAKLAHLVDLDGRRVLMAADSNAVEPRLYQHVREAVGPIDVLFLGMECEGAPMSWMYGPLLTTPLSRKMDQSRRLNGSNCARAAEIVTALSPRRVYVYAMGREPWLSHVMVLNYAANSPQIVESNELIDWCRARDIIAERPFMRMESSI